MRASRNGAWLSLWFAGLLSCAAYDVADPDAGTFALCCGGLGTCVPQGLVPASLAPRLAPETCGPALLCAPADAVAQGTFAPVVCTAANGGEGRCLPVCLPDVTRLARLLKTGTCRGGEVCVPCALGPVCQ